MAAAAAVNACAACGCRSEAIDTRPRVDGSVRRRRRCTGCGLKWTTVEIRAVPGVSYVAVPLGFAQRLKQLLAEISTIVPTDDEDPDADR